MMCIDDLMMWALNKNVSILVEEKMEFSLKKRYRVSISVVAECPHDGADMLFDILGLEWTEKSE